MSFFQTELLLKEHGIIPNKKMGQTFMIDSSIFHKLSEYASLCKTDVVLDVGAGFGFFTKFLAQICGKVVAVEKDKKILEVLKDQLKSFKNVSIVKGDILKVDLPKFNKVVSIPPYYLSSRLISWLFQQKIDCAVLIMQKAFTEKLLALTDTDSYGWLTVISQYYAKIDLLDEIMAEKFYPKPEVDSAIVRIFPWSVPPFKVFDPKLFNNVIKYLFTNRNKKLPNAIRPFLKKNFNFSKLDIQNFLSVFSFREKRVRQLSAKEFGDLINDLTK